MCIRDRYLPFNGFSKRHLLPTDRAAWTDEHAGSVADAAVSLENLNRDRAAPGWRWDDVPWWMIPEPGHDGDGWCYAVDFPMSWGQHERVSCVRRRRYERRRIATGGNWEVLDATAAAADDIVARGNAPQLHVARGGTRCAMEAEPLRSRVGRAAERGANIASNMFCAGFGGAAGATIGSRVGHRISRAIGL
eukprot:TRINITY_DN5065_c0_g2_i2.p1 TRINITY_DN5065_c0_g2~~TRINITY_DN5065_c0_g2_i2.p1  ORF type:complete len:192 (+),score=18.96 TRINITY_DN5065_c0_g2_i2:114-689(+)